MLSSLFVVTLPFVLQLAAAPGNVSGRATAMPTAAAENATPASVRPATIVRQTRAAIRFVVAPEGNEVRYRVREQLAGVDFPNDAVGRTSRVEGAIVIGDDGRFVREESRFIVDVVSLESDQSRRDGYLRRNTLKTDSFPTVTFVPTSARGLPATLPATGDLTFELIGDLTVRNVTKPVTWQVKATRGSSGAVTGTATTSFNFAEFSLPVPRVARVLSVDDNITLEYDFNLVPQANAER